MRVDRAIFVRRCYITMPFNVQPWAMMKADAIRGCEECPWVDRS